MEVFVAELGPVEARVGRHGAHIGRSTNAMRSKKGGESGWRATRFPPPLRVTPLPLPTLEGGPHFSPFPFKISAHIPRCTERSLWGAKPAPTRHFFAHLKRLTISSWPEVGFVERGSRRCSPGGCCGSWGRRRRPAGAWAFCSSKEPPQLRRSPSLSNDDTGVLIMQSSSHSLRLNVHKVNVHKHLNSGYTHKGEFTQAGLASPMRQGAEVGICGRISGA